MPAFPRSILPQTATPFLMPGALQSMGQTGKLQTRQTAQAGRTWRETFPPFKSNTVAGRELLSAINQYWLGGTAFTIQHQLYLTPLGNAGGSPTITVPSQTGTSLQSGNWTGANPILRRGDLLQLPGIQRVFEVTQDIDQTAGFAQLEVWPPIYAGGSPTNGGAIVYTGVTLTAYLRDVQGLADAEADPVHIVEGLTLTFQEAV